MGCLIAVGAVAAIVALWGVAIAILAAILSLAWNLVVPTTFGGPVLDFGAAFALVVVLVVIRLIFGRGSSQ